MSGLVSFPSGFATNKSNCSPNVSLSTGSNSPVIPLDEAAFDTQSLSLSFMSILNPFIPVSFSVMMPLMTSCCVPDKVIMTSLSTCSPFIATALSDKNMILMPFGTGWLSSNRISPSTVILVDFLDSFSSLRHSACMNS